MSRPLDKGFSLTPWGVTLVRASFLLSFVKAYVDQRGEILYIDMAALKKYHSAHLLL